MLRNIEAERVRKGLTQEQLADELGVSRRSYSNYVNENNNIPSTVLVRMAKFFSVSVDYLLAKTEEQ